MQIAEIVQANGSQLVKLPQEFHFQGNTVSIRRQGEALILEPVKPSTWPAGFFDRIFIDDPSFARQPQGTVPPAPKLD
jgi:antitoxin VapB